VTVDAALPAAAASVRPRTLTLGAWFSIAQGVVIAAYGVYVVVAPLVTTSRTGVGMAEFAGVLLLLMGLLPLAAGRALLRLKRWGRSPAVMLDTLCLAVAYFACENGGAFVALGVAVGLAGIAGIVLLLHPRTTAALWPSGQ
jgi:uncharacterized membrane protein HdeD (DUF308 family)